MKLASGDKAIRVDRLISIMTLLQPGWLIRAILATENLAVFSDDDTQIGYIDVKNESFRSFEEM